MNLNAKQAVASADEHPEFITESHIRHVEMLVITESDTKYQKRDKNVHDFSKVNNHLTNARLAALETQDEVPTTCENV